MLESEKTIGRIEAIASLSVQVAAMITLSVDPTVTLTLREVREDLDPRLNRAHWHHRLHRN
jgi:hypothetical protein